MCGICGFTGATETDAPTLKAMCDIMAHRGPDGEGQYLADGVALGHRRLSLIDLENGSQPMVRATGEHAARITSPALMPDGAPCASPEAAAAKGDYACRSTSDGVTCWNTKSGKSFALARAGWMTGTNGEITPANFAWNQ